MDQKPFLSESQELQDDTHQIILVFGEPERLNGERKQSLKTNVPASSAHADM